MTSVYVCVCSGKRKCAENPKHVLKVLTDLLGHENHEVKNTNTYTNTHIHTDIQVPGSQNSMAPNLHT